MSDEIKGGSWEYQCMAARELKDIYKAEVDAVKRDLSDALAMLRSVQGYLEAGMCGCLYDGAYLSTCRRCDLLDDVKTTIANCGT